METWRQHRALFAVYMLTFLYALHYGIPLYVTSSYLAEKYSQAGVSLLYGIAAFITLISSQYISKYLRRFHTYSFTFFLVIGEIFVTTAFALTNSTFYLGLFFIAHFLLQAILFTSINVYIENLTPLHKTGLVRGVFLTLLNFGILVSPFIGGLLLARVGYVGVYSACVVMLLPFLFFLHHYLKMVPDPRFSGVNLYGAFKRAWKESDLRTILLVQMVLESFYAIMTIYMPIYMMTQHIELSVFLAIIMPFVLVPLVIMPYELGILADEKYGEKEMLLLGLIIMCGSLFIIGFIHTSSILIWAFVLFISRIGASFVETMAYTYYFKKISSRDAALTTLFGNTRNLATIVAPGAVFLLSPLIIGSPQMIFFLFAIVVAASIHHTLVLHDTK